MNDVIFELNERVQSTNNLYYLYIAISFTLLALSRLSQRNIFPVVGGMLLRTSDIRSYNKEVGGIGLLPGILLLLNFCLAVFFISYHFFNLLPTLDLLQFSNELLIVASPLAYPFVTALLMLVLGWLTGGSVYTKVPVLIDFSTVLFTGFALSFLILFYTINVHYQYEIILAGVLIYSSLFLWRIIRSIIVTLKAGMPWYYIILYLCTLEILPLVVMYYTFN